MFEGLSDKLSAVFRRLKGEGKITEDDLRAALREIRVALLEAVYREEVGRLCAEGDRLLESDTEPGEALAEWLRVYVSFGAMKRGLMGPLTTALGQDSDLFSSCKTMVRATGGRLVEQAQKAGTIRDDVEISDVLTLASAISHAGELTGEGSELSERLLTVAIDGLRRPRD